MPLKTLGNVKQLAFVPADMDAALRYWTETIGAGPFFMMRNIVPLGIRFMGEDTTFDYSVALANWGDMQIELIAQHDDIPSIYSDWLRAGHQGLHHVSLHTDDIETAKRLCTAAGGTIVQEFLLEGSGAIYADFGGGPGSLVEVLQMNADFHAMFDGIAAAARDWDGTRPVREMAELIG